MPGTSSPAKAAVLEATRAHVAPHRVSVWDAFGTQLVMGRREGYRMWDLSGHALLDFHLNGGTFNLGHRNPRGDRGARGGARRGRHRQPPLRQPGAGALGEELARLTPGDLTYSVFTSGGSEAIDVAIKTARHATGRRRLVVLDAGYHGRTGLSGAAGDDAGARRFLSDQPADFTKVPFGDSARWSARWPAATSRRCCWRRCPRPTASRCRRTGYLPAVARLAAAAGALYLADEVQAGLGRTGPAVGRRGTSASSPTCWSPARASRAASTRPRRA